jgi:DNA invertase Pin-like site-specific DNA recombinase
VSLDRPALQQLLADCSAGKIGVVLVKDADRLSRDKNQLIALLYRFRISGVQVEFANESPADARFRDLVPARGVRVRHSGIRVSL